ncbi:hypothetical protein CQ018_08515 [Arthrobacter sp. MYb227]|nr:hypothetical protein CQ018_08515 [Arthrobacter sp. MYb227]
MKISEEASRYLARLKDSVERIIPELPEGVEGRVYHHGHSVCVDLKGGSLGVFTLVLGSEAPELHYDNRYRDFRTVPEGLDETIEFAQDAFHEISRFILQRGPVIEHKSRILRRPYFPIPRINGPDWHLTKIRR